MRVLIYPHQLTVGGSQLNAIELAGQLQRDGHDVVVFGQDGPLSTRLSELGLEYIASPAPHVRPDLRITRALRREVTRRRIDVVHGWEWPPILEAMAAAHGTGAVAVGSVMSMSVAPFIPRWAPLTVGTRQIAALEQQLGRSRVSVLEPPIDLEANRSGPDNGGRAFRQRFGVEEDELLLVSVSRLARTLKLEGLVTAAEVVGDLASTYPVRLVIVGDGEARDEVEAAAARANARAGRTIVSLAGNMSDPRPAYAAADISLGMGGSALRCLAFGNPLVVQGELGFWEVLSPATVDEFRWGGWYGVGERSSDGAIRLRSVIEPLVTQPDLRSQLGAFGREVAEEFSLGASAARLAAWYSDALASLQDGRGVTFSEFLRSAGGVTRFVAAEQAARLARTRRASEDFNSVAAMRGKPNALPGVTR